MEPANLPGMTDLPLTDRIRRMHSLPTRFPIPTRSAAAFVATLILGLVATPATAEKITNPVAVFSGLDKITGRIISFDVYVDETVQFGALQVTPRACYTRPLSEAPQTTTFVEVDEITLDNKVRRIFTGWMFASTPGLHAVEHPVYDVWLTGCKQETNVPPPAGNAAAQAAADAAAQREQAASSTAETSPQDQGTTAPAAEDGPLPPDVPRLKPSF